MLKFFHFLWQKGMSKDKKGTILIGHKYPKCKNCLKTVLKRSIYDDKKGQKSLKKAKSAKGV